MDRVCGVGARGVFNCPTSGRYRAKAPGLRHLGSGRALEGDGTEFSTMTKVGAKSPRGDASLSLL